MSGRRAIRRMLHRPRVWVWFAIAVLVYGVGLGFVPLFDVLGYELALAASLLAAVSGLDLGAALARELQWMNEPAIARARYPGWTLVRTSIAAAGLAVALIIVPALFAAVRGIWRPTCDWWFGIMAYLALPIVTAAFAGVLGHAIGAATGARLPHDARADRRIGLAVIGALAIAIGTIVGVYAETVVGGSLVGGVVAIVLGAVVWLLAPHRSTVVALTVPLALLAGAGLHHFYAAPPVFTYNAIIGYFPGNLYDENIELGAALWWSRLEQLVWLVAIVAAVAARLDVPRFRIGREPRPAGRRAGAIAIALLGIGAGVAMYMYSGALGYRIDADEIEAELAGRVETAHFVIHYAKTPEIERDIGLIATDHELRYAQVVAQLGIAPAGKLRSFYFANREQKAHWIGAKDVEMAKPWRREIYIDHRAFPHGSLRHEIAHAIASSFGDPIFGVAAQRFAGIPTLISPGLIEGLAVAVDWPAGYERLTPHEQVRAMQAMGVTPTITDLLSLRFLTVSSARSYTTAGSFMRFLLDRYGPAALRTLYATGGDFEAAYATSMDVLEREWRAMIAAIPLPPSEVEALRERFRHGSVFARPCPHANAARHEQARQAYADGKRAHAITLMRSVCRDAPEEPRYRLDLADLLVSGSSLDRVEALAIWTTISSGEQATSSLRVQALERLAHHAAATGDMKLTTQLIARARELPVDQDARRQLEAEWFALQHQGPAGPALRGYFFAPAGAFDAPAWALLATIAEPGLGLGDYLLGLQKTNGGEWQASAVALDAALQKGLPSLPFTRNAARKLVLAAYRANDRARSAHAIAVLRGRDMGETDRLLAADWQQRLDFVK